MFALNWTIVNGAAEKKNTIVKGYISISKVEKSHSCYIKAFILWFRQLSGRYPKSYEVTLDPCNTILSLMAAVSHTKKEGIK